MRAAGDFLTQHASVIGLSLMTEGAPQSLVEVECRALMGGIATLCGRYRRAPAERKLACLAGMDAALLSR